RPSRAPPRRAGPLSPPSGTGNVALAASRRRRAGSGELTFLGFELIDGSLAPREAPADDRQPGASTRRSAPARPASFPDPRPGSARRHTGTEGGSGSRTEGAPGRAPRRGAPRGGSRSRRG